MVESDVGRLFPHRPVQALDSWTKQGSREYNSSLIIVAGYEKRKGEEEG